MDIHNRSHRLENGLERLENSSFSPQNVKALEEFIEGLESENLSIDRTSRYLSSFLVLDHLIDFELEEASEKQLRNLIADINSGEARPDTEQSPWTRNEYRKAVKKFYTWNGQEDKVDFISMNVPKHKRPKVSREELPEVPTVKKMRQNLQNSRDKALITILWESGGRISEVLNAKWKHYRKGQRADRIKFVESKTQPRTVPIKSSRAWLESWREDDNADNADNYIFTTFKKPSQMTYRGAQGQFQTARKHAEDIPEHIKTNFHAFRKSRATYLAENGFNVYQLMAFFGWEAPETALFYVKLAQSNLEHAFIQQFDQQRRQLRQPSQNVSAQSSRLKDLEDIIDL